MIFNKTIMAKYAVLMIRYGTTGLIGVIVNMAVYATLFNVYNVWYIHAAVSGFLLAFVVTFTLHKYWTFKEYSIERVSQQGWLFLFSALSILIINIALLHFFITVFRLQPILAQLLSLGTTAGVSFLFTTQITFHQNANRLEVLMQETIRYGSLHRKEMIWLLTGFSISIIFSLVYYSFAHVIVFHL